MYETNKQKPQTRKFLLSFITCLLIPLVHTERTVFLILLKHIHGSFLLNLRNMCQEHKQYLASLHSYI